MDNPATHKWRVTVGDDAPKSFRSQNKAYEFVREHLPSGRRIVVREWENGRWRLYETFDAAPPDDSPDAAGTRLANN